MGDVDAVIHSAALFRGVMKGYGLVFTPSSLIGCKKYTEGNYWAFPAQLDEAGRTTAAGVVADLTKDKDFEVATSDLQSIEIKEPGRFKPGNVLLKTSQGEIKISVSGSLGTGSKNILELLTKMFEQFAPGKLKKA